MEMTQEQILNQIKEVAKATIPVGSYAYLYGSKARGTSHKNSDWDILLIMDKPKIEQIDYDNIVYPFTSLGWEIDQMIIPVLYTKDEWLASKCTPFYKSVINDAISLL